MKRWGMMLNRPESMLAVSVIGLFAGVAVLLNLALMSCESGGRATGRPPLGGEPAGSARGPGGSGGVSGGGASPVPDTGEPEMRVRVIAAGESITVSSPVGLLIGPSASVAQTIRPVVTITLDAGQWRINGLGSSGSGGGGGRGAEISHWPALAGGSGGTEATGWDGGLWIGAVGGSGTPAQVRGMVNINGTVYAGRFRLLARSDVSPRAFDVIEHVGLEDYLPGVVQKEMLTNWPLAAYQVQAVCARTYAMQERARSRAASGSGGGGAFDLEATDRDQVYSGAGVNRVALDAVASTRGMAIMYQGGVLRAYYSSTCGGRTASARDTWPITRGFEYNLAAPIQARTREWACNASPLYRWTVTRNKSETVKRFVTFGEKNQLLIRRLKDLAAIEVMEVNADNRPSKFRIIEPGGTWYALSGEELRLAFNTPVPGFPEIQRNTRVASSDIEVGVKGTSLTIKGRGFGHGVGMCQYCSKAFAERGEDWRSIVMRFYPGAAIEKAY